ncbi:HET domain protein [Penicillium lividum]|nr:HET domain protein [Penicillium lividum]
MKDNMKQLKESIDYETLPKTIQDVIRVAQGLGVRYVWVDALCIVQDDEEVKKQQIDQMKNIYGNSYLAVQAANVNTVMESFLKPRDLPKPFKLRYDECSHIYLRGYTPDRFPKGLARKRAWVFQESVLPDRLLSYGDDQIIFQCREEAQWEDGFRSNRQDSNSPALLSPLDWRRDYSGSRLDQPTPPPNRRLDFLAAWYTAVDQYTSRGLTYPGDRLPAISGAALRLQEEIGGRYVAGIWESDLPWGLLWESKNTARYPRTKPAMWKMSRPVTSRAPSWSWVAVDGSTKHEFWKRHNDTREQAPVASVSMQSFQVDTVGGIINNGMLEIAAPLFYTSVVLKTNPRYKPYRVSGVKPLLVWDALEKEEWVMPGTDRPTAIANFDIQDEQVLHSGVWCLLICRTVALMLECVDEKKQVFRRLGTCYVIPEFWPSSANDMARGNVFII